jgi:hypothetical protein
MGERLEEQPIDGYRLAKVYSRSKSGTYTSFIGREHSSDVDYSITVYDLAQFSRFPGFVSFLAKRLRFIYQNYRLFGCRAVFFDTVIPSPKFIKRTNICRLIHRFYVVEPILPTFDEYYRTDQTALSSDIFADLFCILASLHDHGFVYGYLSPGMIFVNASTSKLSLRVPPLLPVFPCRSGISPAVSLGGSRSTFLSHASIRFYLPPESGFEGIADMNDLTVAWDCWSLGVFILNFCVLNGQELFASVSGRDQRARIQEVLGPAPEAFGWGPAEGDGEAIELPPFVAEFLRFRSGERMRLKDLTLEAFLAGVESCRKNER